MTNDELQLYRGKDFIVSNRIVIRQPTLNEICDFGEQKYFMFLRYFTATPQTLKVDLWDNGYDYTKIKPFELFYNSIYNMFSVDETRILFGSLDFTKFQRYVKIENENKIPILIQEIDGERVEIDEFTYKVITDYLREVHLIEKDEKIPANETTKRILIEDERDEIALNKNKVWHSQLKNWISSMINCEGFKENHITVWDMRINAFLDSVKRISKMKNANLLLQSGYSGFGINLKDIKKEELNWMGEL